MAVWQEYLEAEGDVRLCSCLQQGDLQHLGELERGVFGSERICDLTRGKLLGHDVSK